MRPIEFIFGEKKIFFDKNDYQLVSMLRFFITLLIDFQATKLWQSYKEGAQLIWNNRPILWIGIVQSIIESCMYIFVFLWTPVLLIPKNNEVPLGMIFSCFMVCIMIGSSIFSWFNTKGKQISYISTLQQFK